MLGLEMEYPGVDQSDLVFGKRKLSFARVLGTDGDASWFLSLRPT